MNKNYTTYSTLDFLEDPSFIDWVKGSLSKEQNDFWKNWIAQNPKNLQAAKDAALQLKVIYSLQRIAPVAALQEEVWQQIDKTIQQNKKTAKIKYLKSWTIAASIILVLGAGLMVWLNHDGHQSAKTQIAVAGKPDVAPGGNKAVLTLADGSKIVLDSLKNGAISKQGGITVIKLKDGRLSYKIENTTDKQAVTYNTIATPRGGQYQIVLSDGTKVWLNAASSLKFPTSFTGSNRDVILTGEGYFEVAHNAAKPFYVHTAQMDVKVLGTHFNVNVYQDEKAVKTTLLEGAVKVRTQTGNTVSLKPGEQARLQKDNGRLQKREDVNLEAAVAWKDGYFYFNNADIQTVMRQLSKWYNIDVQYQGTPTKETFSGKVYRNMSLQNVLEVLRFSSLNVKISGRTLTLSAY